MIIDWQNVDVVLLDMDGTLLDLHFDNFFWQHHLPAAYAAKLGVEPEHAENLLQNYFSAVEGTLDWYSLDYWQHQLGLDIVALKQEIKHLIAVRPGVWQFLEFLQKLGKQRILVTNAHRASMDLKMNLTNVDSCLDRLISTHDFGHPKEDQVFWQMLCQSESLDPARTLFIDDTPRILDAAGHFGIRYLWAVGEPDSRAGTRPRGTYPQVRSFTPLVVLPPSPAGQEAGSCE